MVELQRFRQKVPTNMREFIPVIAVLLAIEEEDRRLGIRLLNCFDNERCQNSFPYIDSISYE